MKTKNKLGLLFIISIVFTECNIYVGEEPQYVYDLTYKNKSSESINIITFFKGKKVDDIKIPKGQSCNFNNIKVEFEKVSNPVFKSVDNTYYRDSILIIKNEIQKNSNGRSCKSYILRKGPYDEIAIDNNFWRAEVAFNLYGYENGITKDRSAFSLNKGIASTTLYFEDEDFAQGLKMYDYESRGL